MAQHKIIRLEGPYLIAAVWKTRGAEVRLGKHPQIPFYDGVYCQYLVPGCQGPKIWVGDKWVNVARLSWYDFGHVLESNWLQINDQLVRWYGPHCGLEIHNPARENILASFARAYVRANSGESSTIDLPDPVPYEELEQHDHKPQA